MQRYRDKSKWYIGTPIKRLKYRTQMEMEKRYFRAIVDFMEDMSVRYLMVAVDQIICLKKEDHLFVPWRLREIFGSRFKGAKFIQICNAAVYLEFDLRSGRHYCHLWPLFTDIYSGVGQQIAVLLVFKGGIVKTKWCTINSIQTPNPESIRSYTMSTVFAIGIRDSVKFQRLVSSSTST